MCVCVCSDALFGYVAIIERYEGGGAAYTLEMKNIDHLMGLIQSQIKRQNNYPSTRVVSLSGVYRVFYPRGHLHSLLITLNNMYTNCHIAENATKKNLYLLLLTMIL